MNCHSLKQNEAQSACAVNKQVSQIVYKRCHRNTASILIDIKTINLCAVQCCQLIKDYQFLLLVLSQFVLRFWQKMLRYKDINLYMVYFSSLVSLILTHFQGHFGTIKIKMKVAFYITVKRCEVNVCRRGGTCKRE